MTTPAPRAICPPDHKHDQSDTCYNNHRCGCTPCRERNNENHRRLTRLRAYGIPTNNWVDAAPVREHINHLREFGIGARQIGRLTGYNHARISFVIWGRASRRGDQRRPATPPAYISRPFAQKILAVKPDLSILTDRTYIPARGTQRRLQALAALGWTNAEIANMMGVRENRISYIVYHQKKVTVVTHREVSDLFDELWDRPAPETPENRVTRSRARKYAAARGWLPPLAWDDIDNDPTPPSAQRTAELDEIAIELVKNGVSGLNLTRAERHEVVKHFHALHWSDGRIADLVGVDERTILRDRDDLGLEAFDQTELIRRDAA